MSKTTRSGGFISILRVTFFVALGLSTTASASPQVEARLGEALSLAASGGNAERTFGWSAVTGELKLLVASGGSIDETLAARIERDAVAANQPHSLKALLALYRMSPELRRARLTFSGQAPAAVRPPGPPGSDAPVSAPPSVEYVVAVLAAASSPDVGEIRDLPAGDWQNVTWLAQRGPGMTPPVGVRTAVGRILAGPSDLRRGLATLLVSRLPGEVQAELFDGKAHAQLATLLGECAQLTVSQPAIELVRAACSSTFRGGFSGGVFDKVALRAMLSELDLKRLDGVGRNNGLESMDMAITVDPRSSVTSQGKTITAANVRNPNPSIPNDAFINGWSFAESEHTRSAWWALYRSSFEPPDTPGIKVPELGMKMGSLVRPGGTSDLRFEVRAALQPAQESLWIAARFLSPQPIRVKPGQISLPPAPPRWIEEPVHEYGTNDGVRCIAGCLSMKPAAIEPGTGWAIFALEPGRRKPVEFSTNVKVPSWVDSTFQWSPETHHYFQILDLSAYHAGRLARLSPQDLAARTPDSRPQNGLLSYAGSLQLAVGAGDWLAPQGPVELATAQALARLSTLQQLSKLSAAGLKANSAAENDPRSPWKARQEYLKEAVAAISYRLFDHFSPQLSNDIVQTASVLVPLERVRLRLDGALESLARLSEDQQFALLGQAARGMRLDAPTAAAKERLVTSLFGAQQALAELVREQNERLTLKCELLARLQIDGLTPLPARTTPDSVRELCE